MEETLLDNPNAKTRECTNQIALCTWFLKTCHADITLSLSQTTAMSAFAFGSGSNPSRTQYTSRRNMSPDASDQQQTSSDNLSLHVEIDKPTALGIGAALVVLLLFYVCMRCCKKKTAECYSDCPPQVSQQPSSPFIGKQQPSYLMSVPSSPFMAAPSSPMMMGQSVPYANTPSSPMQQHQSFSSTNF